MSGRDRLVDGFGRLHTDSRVGITDRCTSCMPLDGDASWTDGQVLSGAGGTADAIAGLPCDCVAAKRPVHGIGTPAFERPARAMHQIGS